MSDDIREVMKPTQFSPLKRTVRSGNHKSNTEERSGGWAEEQAEDETPVPQEMIDTLEKEVQAANEKLGAAGKSVRLRLAQGADAPFIEIIIPADSGSEVVTRRIAPEDIQAWVTRLETAEGLVIDERF